MAFVSTGITLLFGTSGFEAEFLDIEPPAFERGYVETSHQGTTGGHTFTPKELIDYGELVANFAFDPATDPPIDGAAETVTITWPDDETWVATMFMTSYKGGGTFEDKAVGSATFKVSGAVAITDASASASASSSGSGSE